MRWSEFQDTVARLAQGNSEGDWRSAPSRSYYAVFHCFRDFLEAHGLNVGRGGQSHFNVYTGLCQCGVAPMATLANRIDSLRAVRVRADYDLGCTFVAADAQDGVQEAQAVIAEFQSLLATTSAAQIADGARRHLQAIGRLGRMP